MKDDPFATLSGLDQQLFKDKNRSRQRSNETTKQRRFQTTRTRASEGRIEKTRSSRHE